MTRHARRIEIEAIEALKKRRGGFSVIEICASIRRKKKKKQDFGWMSRQYLQAKAMEVAAGKSPPLQAAFGSWGAGQRARGLLVPMN